MSILFRPQAHFTTVSIAQTICWMVGWLVINLSPKNSNKLLIQLWRLILYLWSHYPIILFTTGKIASYGKIEFTTHLYKWLLWISTRKLTSSLASGRLWLWSPRSFLCACVNDVQKWLPRLTIVSLVIDAHQSRLASALNTPKPRVKEPQ